MEGLAYAGGLVEESASLAQHSSRKRAALLYTHATVLSVNTSESIAYFCSSSNMVVPRAPIMQVFDGQPLSAISTV